MSKAVWEPISPVVPPNYDLPKRYKYENLTPIERAEQEVQAESQRVEELKKAIKDVEDWNWQRHGPKKMRDELALKAKLAQQEDFYNHVIPTRWPVRQMGRDMWDSFCGLKGVVDCTRSGLSVLGRSDCCHDSRPDIRQMAEEVRELNAKIDALQAKLDEERGEEGESTPPSLDSAFKAPMKSSMKGSSMRPSGLRASIQARVNIPKGFDADLVPEVKEVFEAWDADGNGSISKKELHIALRHLHLGNDQKSMLIKKEILTHIDATGDEEVDFDELVAEMAKISNFYSSKDEFRMMLKEMTNTQSSRRESMRRIDSL